MSKIYLNYNNLKYDCVENINEVIKYLDSVNRYFASMNIPYSYSRRRELINAKNTLEKCNSDLKQIKSWITNSNSYVNDKIDTYNDRANRLPVNSVKRRNQKI